MNKPQIIFVHILKCGGTSLRYALLEQYGYEQVAPVPIGVASGEWDYPYLRGVNPLEYQVTIIPEMMQDYFVVMSHYDWRIVNNLPERDVITMFRHPVEQLHSLFRFIQFNHDLQVMHKNMQQMSFLEWLKSGKADPLLNTQTRYMSGHGCEDIDVALDNLRDERLTFGLVERFNQSIQLFNQKFGWSLKVRHDNHNPNQGVLSEEVVRLVEDLQSDDMRLYRVAGELFDAQFEDI